MNKLYTCSVNGSRPVKTVATSAPEAKAIYAAQMSVSKSSVTAKFERNIKPTERATDILKDLNPFSAL